MSIVNNGKMLHSSKLHTFDMKYKYMKSTYVVMLSLLWFVACESKSNYIIYSTSLIKKCLFCDNFQLLNNGAHINVPSCLSSNKLYSVHPSSLSGGVGVGGGGRGLSLLLNKFSKKKGLTWSQSLDLRVVAGKDRGDFFQ